MSKIHIKTTLLNINIIFSIQLSCTILIRFSNFKIEIPMSWLSITQTYQYLHFKV